VESFAQKRVSKRVHFRENALFSTFLKKLFKSTTFSGYFCSLLSRKFNDKTAQKWWSGTVELMILSKKSKKRHFSQLFSRIPRVRSQQAKTLLFEKSRKKQESALFRDLLSVSGNPSFRPDHLPQTGG